MKNIVNSPCINFCEMNKDIELCKGCFRTIAEIANWGNMSANQKEVIYFEIEKRKSKLHRK